MPVDRTAELRAAAQVHAQRAGRDPVRAAASAAERARSAHRRSPEGLTSCCARRAQAALLTPPPPPPRSDFARGAASVGAGIAALRAFAAARRRDYTEAGRVSEAERDGIEAEVSSAIRDYRERIDALKEAAPAAAAAAAAEASKRVRPEPTPLPPCVVRLMV